MGGNCRGTSAGCGRGGVGVGGGGGIGSDGSGGGGGGDDNSGGDKVVEVTRSETLPSLGSTCVVLAEDDDNDESDSPDEDKCEGASGAV